uniref:DUF834 domain-containing protein n=1 Tax=Setaria viridis TaxID=4556 RepID=A0A4U6UWB9_SETVI|nr:hypothetical protein SEVIR_4G043003v2 [Setaria viridis]
MLTVGLLAKARAWRGLGGSGTVKGGAAASAGLGGDIPAASKLGDGNGQRLELREVVAEQFAAAAESEAAWRWALHGGVNGGKKGEQSRGGETRAEGRTGERVPAFIAAGERGMRDGATALAEGTGGVPGHCCRHKWRRRHWRTGEATARGAAGKVAGSGRSERAHEEQLCQGVGLARLALEASRSSSGWRRRRCRASIRGDARGQSSSRRRCVPSSKVGLTGAGGDRGAYWLRGA